MKRMLAILGIGALLLCGCGADPAEVTTVPETTAVQETRALETEPADPYEAMTEEEKAVAQCRAVLDAVQSGEQYQITLTKQHEGVSEETVQIEYYRNGNDRAMVARRAKDDFLHWGGSNIRVCKDGITYTGYSADNTSIDWDGGVQETLEFDPWMYTFDWDAQEVELTEIRKTKEGRCISFLVHAVYDINYGFADNYTIAFYFDDDGNFLKRELIATAQETTPTYREVNGEWVRLQPDDPELEKTGRFVTRADRVTVDSLDPGKIGAEIDRLYQDALTHGKG